MRQIPLAFVFGCLSLVFPQVFAESSAERFEKEVTETLSYRNPELYSWLLSQRLEKSSPN